METKKNGIESSSVPTNEAIKEKVIKWVILVVILISLLIFVQNYYSPYNETSDEEKQDSTEITNETENVSDVKNASDLFVRPKLNVNKQPACPKSHMLVILEEICAELIIEKEFCKPEDVHNKSKHKIPKALRRKSPNNEPKVPAIMNYVVGALLIISLGAAFMELYKAKKQAPKKNGKCPLSRKSSLADLTVMKHQRKELIRRESIMEVPEENLQQKQLGTLKRRCSFPVGPSTNATRRCEDVVNQQISEDPSVEMRRMSTSDSRRHSILESFGDYRMTPSDVRRPSIDDSPERRHHMLVHRH